MLADYIFKLLDYNKKNNLEKFFKKYSENKYQTRGAKTWLTKEWAKNIADWLRWLDSSRVANWAKDKWFTKKQSKELTENMRYLSKKFDEIAEMTDFVEYEAIKWVSMVLIKAWIKEPAASKISAVIVQFLM